MPKLKLTDTAVEKKCIAHDGKTTWYSDTKTKGLQLCVTPGGSRTWYLNKWDPNAQKVRRVKLGQFATKGNHTKWARSQAGKKASKIEAGEVLTREERAREKAGVPTLREAFEMDVARRQNPDDPNDKPVSEQTVAYYRTLLGKHVGELLDQTVDALDGRTIQRNLDDLYRSSPYAAHKLHCALRYARPQVEKALNTENLPYRWPRLDKLPTMRDRKDVDRKNAKVVMDVSIPWSVRWAKIQDVENEVKRLCWQIRWYSGFRGVGLYSLTWDDVDLQAGTFMVSTGLKRVTGKRLIAMSDQVKHWFERLHEIRYDDCPWVFPSRRIVGDERGHLSPLDSLDMDGPVEFSMGSGHLRHCWNEAAADVDCREMILHWLTGQALNKGDAKNLGLYATIPVERQHRVANEIASVITSRIEETPANVVAISR